MRIHTLLLTLGGLALAEACSRGSTVVVTQPEPSTAADRTNEQAPHPASTAARLGIPPGHLPEIGQCRIWVPGVPPGQQRYPQSLSCIVIGAPPAGSWLLFRPTSDRKIVRVRVIHDVHAGVVTNVRIFRISDGAWVRDMRPEHEPEDNQLRVVSRDTNALRTDRPRERTDPRSPYSERVEPVNPRPRSDSTSTGRPDDPASPFDVPRGHLPEPGRCRVWIPGTPPGQQADPKSAPCDGINAFAPPASWILYRPAHDVRIVHVRVVDPRRPGTVIVTRVYSIETRQLLREETP